MKLWSKILAVLVIASMLTACSGTDKVVGIPPENTASDAAESNGNETAGQKVDDVGSDTLTGDDSAIDTEASERTNDDTDISAEDGEAGDNGSASTEAVSESDPIDDGTGSDDHGATTKPSLPKDYEKKLAALVLFALSMDYPDFRLEGIYMNSSAIDAEKQSDRGVYAVVDNGGNRFVFSAFPIDGERSEAGTTDLYANELGYASFTMTSDVLTEGMTLLEPAEYSQFLSELSGISILQH